MPDDSQIRLVPDASFIDAPRDPGLQALYHYWKSLRGERTMPSRADFDPAQVPKLLPHIILYNVHGPGNYTVRLVGGAVQDFVGRNTTGQRAGTVMNQRGAAMIVEILGAVASERSPKFRAGIANWMDDKEHRSYEACFLPMSTDGETVDIVLVGAMFPQRAG